MCAKRTFRRTDIDAALKDLLNAPKIPEEEREVSREEALKIMTEGFRNLLNQGYSIKGIIDYLKKTDCPIKDIKQGEIVSLLNSDEGAAPVKRKYRSKTKKIETGNIPELNAPETSGFPPKLKKFDKTHQGGKGGKEQPDEVDPLNLDKGSFPLDNELPLDEI